MVSQVGHARKGMPLAAGLHPNQFLQGCLDTCIKLMPIYQVITSIAYLPTSTYDRIEGIDV